MMVPESDAWHLLRELDGPRITERPSDHDEREVAGRFGTLVEALSLSFACDCVVDAGFPNVQDASFYGDVRVPCEATASGAEIVIRVSNFGFLAIYDIAPFQSVDADEREVVLENSDATRVEAALEASGHVCIPVDLLSRRYDGGNEWVPASARSPSGSLATSTTSSAELPDPRTRRGRSARAICARARIQAHRSCSTTRGR